MTKEEALKKIEELKAYIEECEEKEKEIPEMPHHGDYNVCITVPDKPCKPHIRWERSFENEESAELYSILTFELANLVYAREYLKVNVDDLLKARGYGYAVFRIVFVIEDCDYAVSQVKSRESIFENDRIWCFTYEQDALRVCDYLNKYVKDIKRNMY